MIELTPTQQRLLLENSVERVINSSITALTAHRDGRRTESSVELADQALQDWCDDNEAIKCLVVQLWNDARNQVFKNRLIS